MKQESIHIQNFGPISDVYIKGIKPFTVFIGESGSGKSTIVKLVALFRWIYKMLCIRTFLKGSGIKNAFRFRMDTYLKNNEQDKYVSKNTYVEYTNGSITLIYKNNHLYGTEAGVVVPKDEICLEKIAFFADKRATISDLINNNFSIRKRSFYLNESLDNYLQATEIIKDMTIPGFEQIKLEVRKTSSGTKHYIVSTDDKHPYRIELNEASSGIQTIVPLSVIIEYYANHYNLVEAINRSLLSYVSQSDNWLSFKATTNIGDFPNRRVTLCLEEPELSLFPNVQSQLIEYIVNRCFNLKHDYDMNVLMTSHSPYILNILNVFINEQQESGSFLSPEKLDVFMVSNGHISPLICTDEKGHAVVDTDDLSEEIVKTLNRYENLFAK